MADDAAMNLGRFILTFVPNRFVGSKPRQGHPCEATIIPSWAIGKRSIMGFREMLDSSLSQGMILLILQLFIADDVVFRNFLLLPVGELNCPQLAQNTPNSSFLFP